MPKRKGHTYRPSVCCPDVLAMNVQLLPNAPVTPPHCDECPVGQSDGPFIYCAVHRLFYCPENHVVSRERFVHGTYELLEKT